MAAADFFEGGAEFVGDPVRHHFLPRLSDEGQVGVEFVDHMAAVAGLVFCHRAPSWQVDRLVRHCADARYVWNLALEQTNLYRLGVGSTCS